MCIRWIRDGIEIDWIVRFVEEIKNYGGKAQEFRLWLNWERDDFNSNGVFNWTKVWYDFGIYDRYPVSAISEQIDEKFEEMNNGGDRDRH